MARSVEAALVALEEATNFTVRTPWDEPWSALASIQEQDRDTYVNWLQSMPALSPQTWSAIRWNWIAFLSATSTEPSIDLAPNRKTVQFIRASPQQQNQQRFDNDRRLRCAIQVSIWRLFDELEGLTERWPCQARLVLNRLPISTSTRPFQTLAAKFNFARRRRFNAVWTALLCFLVHTADDNGALEEMGLHLSDDTWDDILDIKSAHLYPRYPEMIQDAL
ncbi:hypothetical protein A1O3_01809 [Capronia epimyces CBS 606.96]|uniref:Uncharacterized protein n=1 Tax=Capronia epimyces CBS 606.96 TaxID=1182542 RepID=W9YK21_9EURO|nr:uncharacterized protein A1O3_01809 [Capronia epimyces CBS 606.96]EXJ93252.1 hypothetical protein A1O3_01809 [Capronia epimyces CBS 606.96]